MLPDYTHIKYSVSFKKVSLLFTGQGEVEMHLVIVRGRVIITKLRTLLLFCFVFMIELLRIALAVDQHGLGHTEILLPPLPEC